VLNCEAKRGVDVKILSHNIGTVFFSPVEADNFYGKVGGHCETWDCALAVLGDGGLRAVLVRPNVRANRPAEAGGVSLARDSGEAAARQAYTACRSGSG